MSMTREPLDAVVVGAGPNGLVAAITLARAGARTLLLEAQDTPGGACKSAELTRPGVVHDIGAAVHVFAVAAPALRDLHLEGVEFLHGRYPLAHPLGGADAAVLDRSIERTAAGLDADGARYMREMTPLAAGLNRLLEQFLGPAIRPVHPVLAAHFATRALLPLTWYARRFTTERARALVAGLAVHSVLPLDAVASTAIALILAATAHASGWPVVRGGSQQLTDALVAEARRQGVRIETGRRVTTLRELPAARVRLLDVTPRQLLRLDDEHSLPPRYRRALGRFRYGPGVCKVDWTLREPIPWTAAACREAVTVHVGGTLEEFSAAEHDVARGRHPDRPFVLLVQPSIVDGTRAPEGLHTAWAYCHVPNGSDVDMTGRIEAQVERFAPGFRDVVVARSTLRTRDIERLDENCIGGDIGGGLIDLRQTLARPVLSFDPYATPVPGLYLCSSSTPPGGGVHGMCGHHAARSALRHLRARG